MYVCVLFACVGFVVLEVRIICIAHTRALVFVCRHVCFCVSPVHVCVGALCVAVCLGVCVRTCVFVFLSVCCVYLSFVVACMCL